MFSIIDIETTGGSYRTEKITEIAIYNHDGEKIVDQFSTLINPERSIPYFITSLTGITNEMVKDAPKFYEVAKKVIEMTEGRTFVAHNSGFDYNFIKQEFKSLGYEFSRKQLCTVKLSRKLLPGFKSYSLGKLCNELGITINGRHRAAGDAFATSILFEKLLQADQERKFIKAPKILRLSGIHPDFDPQLIDRLPQTAGVYYFYNENKDLIYIGKSTKIKKRVISHFTNESSSRSISMKESITDISFTETGSELVALLLESDEIKKHKPRFNRAQRRNSFNHGIFTYTDQNGYLRLYTGKTSGTDSPLIAFSSAIETKNQIESLVNEHELCQKLCGLYESNGSCFYYKIKQCHGACIGEESPEVYNARVEASIEKFRFANNNFMIIDKGRTDDEKTVVLVEHGKYLGFGFIPVERMNGHPSELKDFIQPYPDNKDVRQIIRSHLKHKKVEKLISL